MENRRKYLGEKGGVAIFAIVLFCLLAGSFVVYGVVGF